MVRQVRILFSFSPALNSENNSSSGFTITLPLNPEDDPPKLLTKKYSYTHHHTSEYQ